MSTELLELSVWEAGYAVVERSDLDSWYVFPGLVLVPPRLGAAAWERILLEVTWAVS